jgi:hypothetical protein
MAALPATSPSLGTTPLTLTRNQLARYVAAVFGIVALVLFYQPWVSGTVPGVGAQALTGLELARGDAAARADQALFGVGSAALAAGSGTGAAAGGAAASSGGLALPTRQPTAVTGGPAGGFGSSSAAVGGAGAGASLGGLALPTRIATVTPLPSGQLGAGTGNPAGALIGGQLAGGGTANVVLEIGRQVERQKEPDRLPQFPLYFVPLAALGLATFPVVWDRLYESRDRFFGKVWTLLLAYGGAFGTGYVLFMVSTAVAANDLLGPGEAKGVEWPLWGAFLAFVAATVSITVAWLSPAPPPRNRYARLVS